MLSALISQDLGSAFYDISSSHKYIKVILECTVKILSILRKDHSSHYSTGTLKK